MSTWNGWTNNLDGRKLSNQHLTSKDVKKFCEAIWEEQGWCDITFTAHFLSAKAIYVPSTGEFNFYYDEDSHNEAGIDDYKFGVNNSHIDIRTLDISLQDVVFPSWYWPDGTPKVYPTSVHFDKSFKSYNNLTSMSLWFLSGMFDKSILAYNNADQGSSVFNDLINNFETSVFSLKGQYQPRAITSVTGLENVNTEKLSETAFMFAGSVSDAPLESLDFSSWNTPVLKDTTGMFMYCTYLTDIKFPPTGSGRSFAQAATMMPYMFGMCVSLQNITLPANFGEGAFYMQYMFAECLSLKHFKAEAPKFGANAYNMSRMFLNCQAMHTLELNNNGFGSSCEYAYAMFQNCASLTSLDLSSFYA